MSDEVILSFESVTLPPHPPYEAGLAGVSFSLNAAELMLVRVEQGLSRLAFADAAQGLVEPDSGRVMFLGEDWRSMPPNRAAERRGSIGRVFEANGWISNLDVDENITLAQRHHTSRPEGEIVAEASALAAQFDEVVLARYQETKLRHFHELLSKWIAD